MPNIPEDLSYTKDHEWVREAGGKLTIGITDYAQRQLGDVVFVQLPSAGDRFEEAEPIGTMESVKAVSEIYAPVTGVVDSVNAELDDSPELINTDPYGDGWLVVVNGSASSDGLMDAAQYADYVKEPE